MRLWRSVQFVVEVPPTLLDLLDVSVDGDEGGEALLGSAVLLEAEVPLLGLLVTVCYVCHDALAACFGPFPDAHTLLQHSLYRPVYPTPSWTSSHAISSPRGSPGTIGLGQVMVM